MVHHCCSAAPSMSILLSAANHGDRKKHAYHAQPALEGRTSDIKQKHDYSRNEARPTLKRSMVTISPVVFELCLDATFYLMEANSIFLDAHSSFFGSNSLVLFQTDAVFQW